MTNEEFGVEYEKLAHAIQTGVALEHEYGSTDGAAKHLRVGVNTVKCDHAAIVAVLVDKGIITEDEYYASSLKFLREEVERYEARLALLLGKPITLG